MHIRWLTMSLWGRRLFLLETKNPRTHISSQTELLQFIQCPGGKLLCDLSSESVCLNTLLLLCNCRPPGQLTCNRLTHPWYNRYATHPSASLCLSISVFSSRPICTEPQPNCISEHVLIYQEMQSHENCRLGMLAVRARDIDRDAGILARGGSKKGNERANQIRGTLAIWI